VRGSYASCPAALFVAAPLDLRRRPPRPCTIGWWTASSP
jgi:hypothetical protein